MRGGIDNSWTNALEARGIRTGMVAWFDFMSEPVGVWTGSHTMTLAGTGDSMLDGKQFEPITEGIPIVIGDNTYSYSGSEAFSMTLAIPSTPTNAMIAAQIDPGEYRGRTAIIWRALMVTPPTALSAPVWAFRRVRAGAMDQLDIVHDGSQHVFTLTIEAHASMITNASGSTYLDQPKFDPTDTSQAYAVSIVNNPNTPSSGANTGVGIGTQGIGRMGIQDVESRGAYYRNMLAQ